eukprot:TRINITY_DN13158_c0_g1_i1.p1 TRINITY_DN13158_c0_g1~~TRINITY_DN13158_c0_g1_i1.p1  ORF type:complete len:388 (+),score=34.55 TRINITY_DN13158_c0_g1_i1:94-1257(+)
MAQLSEQSQSADIRVGNRFRILEKLGAGSFGDIYRGVNIVTGAHVAIKLEPLSTKVPQLLPEARLVKFLGRDGPLGNPKLPSVGVTQLHWYGVEGDFNVMIIDMLGPSLEDLFQYNGRQFHPVAVAALGMQMVSRVEFMHSRHMLHRDIKPDNFLAGIGRKAALIYIIDYGLAKAYRDPLTLEHVPYRFGKSFSGTQRYASVNSHLGVEQSRRDDVEAIGYILAYFLRGNLPWQGLREKNKAKAYQVDASPGARRQDVGAREAQERQKRIAEKKTLTSIPSLFKGFPKQFCKYMEYCRGLTFTAKPDYQKLRTMLSEAGRAVSGEATDCYDWLDKIHRPARRPVPSRVLGGVPEAHSTECSPQPADVVPGSPSPPALVDPPLADDKE